MRFLRYMALKSVMGPGRVGPGREYSDFSLKFERTRSARCARSLVIICFLLFASFVSLNYTYREIPKTHLRPRPVPKENGFPINVFAIVHGIANYNQMSRDLHRAEIDLRRKVIHRLEKSTSNAMTRLGSAF